MEDNFLKEIKFADKTEEEKDMELIKSVIKTKLELSVASKNFEYADGDLIDYYTYEIKANQAKLDYLLKKVKNKSLVLDMVNELELRLFENEAM